MTAKTTRTKKTAKYGCADLQTEDRMTECPDDEYGFSEDGDGFEHRLLGYCESCGMAVYTNDEALSVVANGDLIHSACWDWYASEHASEFTISADTDRGM